MLGGLLVGVPELCSVELAPDLCISPEALAAFAAPVVAAESNDACAFKSMRCPSSIEGGRDLTTGLCEAVLTSKYSLLCLTLSDLGVRGGLVNGDTMAEPLVRTERPCFGFLSWSFRARSKYSSIVFAASAVSGVTGMGWLCCLDVLAEDKLAWVGAWSSLFDSSRSTRSSIRGLSFR